MVQSQFSNCQSDFSIGFTAVKISQLNSINYRKFSDNSAWFRIIPLLQYPVSNYIHVASCCKWHSINFNELHWYTVAPRDMPCNMPRRIVVTLSPDLDWATFRSNRRVEFSRTRFGLAWHASLSGNLLADNLGRRLSEVTRSFRVPYCGTICLRNSPAQRIV